MKDLNRTILLATGGTGGHLIPAIAFGKWMNKNIPEWEVRYLTGERPLEREICQFFEITPLQLPLKGSPVGGAPLLEKMRRTWRIIYGIIRSKKHIEENKVSVCLLFGGYVSFPVLIACKISGVPVYIHEQNAYAGKVTRIASMLRVKVFSGWESCLPLKPEKFSFVGMPTRRFILEEKESAWKNILPNDKIPSGPIILVLAGSLGSAHLYEKLIEIAKKKDFANSTFIFPVGASAKSVGKNIKCVPKNWNMQSLYSVSDVVITRGGASTLAELMVLGLPALVIPWQKAADNHQLHNARAFKKKNCVMIWNEDESDLILCEMLQSLINRRNNSMLQKMESMYNKADCACARIWSTVRSVI